jgi:hypothetical protein
MGCLVFSQGATLHAAPNILPTPCPSKSSKIVIRGRQLLRPLSNGEGVEIRQRIAACCL